jgi:TPP-dependent pyruvate/acetoin dehydrogenase alpha subunit
VDRARSGEGPTLIEAKTYRMKGHAEHDAQTYVEKDELEEWRQKDPVARFERHLAAAGILPERDRQVLVAELNRRLDEDVAFAEASPFPDPELALLGVYADEEITRRSMRDVFTGGW